MDNTSISDNRNKLKILYLRDILVRFSDVEHYITLPQIQKKLEEYGVKATRKTLYDDIELLRIYGMTIALDRRKGYRVLAATFPYVMRGVSRRMRSARENFDRYKDRFLSE